MEQTKVKFTFYEEPRVLDEIEEVIDLVEKDEGERITKSCFIRRSIRKEIKRLKKDK